MYCGTTAKWAALPVQIMWKTGVPGLVRWRSETGSSAGRLKRPGEIFSPQRHRVTEIVLNFSVALRLDGIPISYSDSKVGKR